MENGRSSAQEFYKPKCSSSNKSEEQLENVDGQFKQRFGNHRNKTTVGFQRANWKQALKIKQKQSNRYYKGQEISCSVDVQYFKVYGVGLFLFFSFLKKVCILFFLMSLVELIPMIYNYVSGQALAHSSQSFQHFVARMTVGNQIASDDSAQSQKNKLFNVIPDIVLCCMFFIFYFYWERKSYTQAENIRNQVRLPSDLTIQVKRLSSKNTQQKVQKFFSKWGAILEVASVKNYSEMISLSKSIYELSLQIKEINLLSSQETKDDDLQKISQRQQKIMDLVQELQTVEKNRESKIIKYYVSFTDIQTRNQVLKDYEKQNECCRCCNSQHPEQLLINGQFPKIKKCQTQPGGLIWENMHITWKSRWIRMLLQGLLLLILIAAGFLFISFLNIANPSLQTSADTSSYTFQQIKQSNDDTLAQSWCLEQEDMSSEVSTFCTDYLLLYYAKIGSSIGIALSIVVVKLILKQIVIVIAKFQRYKDHTELSTNIMTNLMITYICTTVLITFLLQANLFDISFKNTISPFITNQELIQNLNSLTEYSDFTTDWYVDIGYQIWLNWLILAFVPHIGMPLFHALLEKFNLWMGKKQVLQKNALSYARSEQFQIEDHYANIMMIIFVGFTFSGGIPFMIILSFLGLVTRYIYYKYVFLRFCRIPKTYNQAMNSRMLSIFPITLAFHLVFSLWMYGVNQIFNNDVTAAVDEFIQTTNIKFLQGLAIIWEKIIATWYLTFFIAIFLVIYLLKKIVVDLLMKIICGSEQKYEDNETKITKQQKNKKDIEEQDGQSRVDVSISMKDSVIEEEKQVKKAQKPILSSKSLTKSYKIENNPDYIEILAIMKPQQIQNFLRQTCGFKMLGR